MAFYRKLITYEDVEPHLKRVKKFLRENGELVNFPNEDGYELFVFDEKPGNLAFDKFSTEMMLLMGGRFIQLIPLEPKRYMISVSDMRAGYEQTISPTFIRLPKLSHLISLVPEDFFKLMRLIGDSKISQTKNSIQLDLIKEGLAGVLEESNIGHFFQLVRSNYRINTEYADKKWTSFEDIRMLAKLEPTRENHFSAMQYLTVRQNQDVMYFPIDSAVDLELSDWQQISEDYVIPQYDDNESGFNRR